MSLQYKYYRAEMYTTWRSNYGVTISRSAEIVEYDHPEISIGSSGDRPEERTTEGETIDLRSPKRSPGEKKRLKLVGSPGVLRGVGTGTENVTVPPS